MVPYCVRHSLRTSSLVVLLLATFEQKHERQHVCSLGYVLLILPELSVAKHSIRTAFMLVSKPVVRSRSSRVISAVPDMPARREPSAVKPLGSSRASCPKRSVHAGASKALRRVFPNCQAYTQCTAKISHLPHHICNLAINTLMRNSKSKKMAKT